MSEDVTLAETHSTIFRIFYPFFARLVLLVSGTSKTFEIRYAEISGLAVISQQAPNRRKPKPLDATVASTNAGLNISCPWFIRSTANNAAP